MNENTKTGIFWAVAAVTLAIAAFVAWPASSDTEEGPIAGRPLFKEFKDPLTAASLKIVTFDETLGQLENFEVRKDRQTGVWTIPSRQGYPADAVQQMTDAANSLVGLTILDVQTANAEDHDDLGVVEPKLEDLEIGDSGVGRLVTFKDESQNTVASLIIGKPVEGEEGKIYVRKPGQDPVYVVKLEDAALTTDFQKWIEEDLLQLSSIDISGLEIKDYSASAGLRGVSLNRNYTAEVAFEDSEWKVEKLVEFDPNDPRSSGSEVDISGQEPNAEKLNQMKSALDDLKIVDVVRKPEGMSANLRADQELVSDDEAVMSLAQRGFYPVSLGSGDTREVLSANGELVVTLNDGVEYILRFGNVAGLTEAEESDTDEESVAEGVNRYLLVTTEVDETQFPAPELDEIPEDLDQLETLLRERNQGSASETPDEFSATAEGDADGAAAPEQPADGEAAATDEAADATTADAVTETTSESPADEENRNSATDTSAVGDDAAGDSDELAGDSDDEGEVDVSGSGQGSGSGGGQDPAASDEEEATEATEATDEVESGDGVGEPSQETQPDSASNETDPQPSDTAESSQSETAGSGGAATSEETKASANTGEKQEDGETSDEGTPEANEAAVPEELKGLTRDEKLELLEAEQEKIVKANQRKLDERQEQIDAAARKVRELNARFADWYYVIPESTYQELRVARPELFASADSPEDSAAEQPSATEGSLPNFDFSAPNFPGGE